MARVFLYSFWIRYALLRKTQRTNKVENTSKFRENIFYSNGLTLKAFCLVIYIEIVKNNEKHARKFTITETRKLYMTLNLALNMSFETVVWKLFSFSMKEKFQNFWKIIQNTFFNYFRFKHEWQSSSMKKTFQKAAFECRLLKKNKIDAKHKSESQQKLKGKSYVWKNSKFWTCRKLWTSIERNSNRLHQFGSLNFLDIVETSDGGWNFFRFGKQNKIQSELRCSHGHFQRLDVEF